MGELAPGKLADLVLLDADPLADLRVLRAGKHLTHLIKDGRPIDLGAKPLGSAEELTEKLRLKEAVLTG